MNMVVLLSLNTDLVTSSVCLSVFLVYMIYIFFFMNCLIVHLFVFFVSLSSVIWNYFASSMDSLSLFYILLACMLVSLFMIRWSAIFAVGFMSPCVTYQYARNHGCGSRAPMDGPDSDSTPLSMQWAWVSDSYVSDPDPRSQLHIYWLNFKVRNWTFLPLYIFFLINIENKSLTIGCTKVLDPDSKL